MNALRKLAVMVVIGGFCAAEAHAGIIATPVAVPEGGNTLFLLSGIAVILAVLRRRLHS